jgi:hypothetical protein
MTQPEPTSPRFSLQTLALLLIPVILLIGVIILFVRTGGGLELESAAPIENLSVERYSLTDGIIELELRNTGPQALTIASIIVNDGVMPFTITPHATIPRLGTARVHIPYALSTG